MIDQITKLVGNSAEYRIENKENFNRTFMVYHKDQLVFVIKKVKTTNNDFLALPFDNIIACNNNAKVGSVEIIRIDSTKNFRKSTPEEILKTAQSIYTHNDLILFLKPQVFVSWKHYVDITGWTDITNHYPKEVRTVIFETVKDLSQKLHNLASCKKGWIHGDFHCPNVLLDDDGIAYTIDFDSVRYSYSALNVAQAFYTENFKKHLLGVKGWTWEKVQAQYTETISVLSKCDKQNFKNFMRVMGFYWELRTIPFRSKQPDKRLAQLYDWIRLIGKIYDLKD